MEALSLKIDIVSCKDLLIADLTSSDPYVKVNLGKKDLHKTKHINKTLNPVFTAAHNYSFVLNCTEKELQDNNGLFFRVKDNDTFGHNDEIGNVLVPAEKLIESDGELMEFHLEKPKYMIKNMTKKDAGSITIRVRPALDSQRVASLCENMGMSVEEYHGSQKIRLPILIIPGLASSGLKIEKSAMGESYEGKRVWMNSAMLAAGRLNQNTVLNNDRIEIQKSRSHDEVSEGSFRSEEVGIEVRSSWLYHMSLSDDMVHEREGNRVRPYEGLDGCEYLCDDVVSKQFAMVQAPLTNFLTNKLGYVKGVNVDAATYDWRLPPSHAQERDNYLTKTNERIEKMYTDNLNLPVILFCHSLGCKMGHYFLNHVKENYGQEWIDKYIHTYMPVGAPHMGVSLAVRSVLMGAGLAAPVDLMMAGDDEGLVLYRSFGSAAWLMPRSIPPNAIPSVICRREGELAVAIVGNIEFGTLFKGRTNPKELRLVIHYQADQKIYSNYVLISPEDTSFYIEETYYIAIPEIKDQGQERPFGFLYFSLEDPGSLVHMDKADKNSLRVMLSKATDNSVMKSIKRSYIKAQKGLQKSLGVGEEIAYGVSGDLRPSDFLSCDDNTLKKEYCLYHPTFYSNQGKIKLALKYTPCSIATNETETPIACIDEALSSVDLPITSAKKNELHMDLTYNYLSGNQMFDKSLVKEKFNKMVKERYEDDPLGPKTKSSLDCPPVKRVRAIYGINLKTEVCTVFRRRPYFVIGDDQADSRFIVDSETQVGDDAILNNYDFEGGKFYETEKTVQKTINDDGEEIERAVCGDGTVPYWNLVHSKTWKPDLEELTVDEVVGGEHRTILSHPTFQELLRKYCLIDK